MLDLDDLEVETLRLFQDHPDVCRTCARKFNWIFVDEYQDTNPIQVEILKALVHANHIDAQAETENFSQDQEEQGIVRRHTLSMSHKQSRSSTQSLGKRAVSARICAIGDPNQAIYGFRGADVLNFHRFEEDFPGRVITTEYGDFYLCEKWLSEFHSNAEKVTQQYVDFFESALPSDIHIDFQALLSFNPSQVLFLDIETTGLSNSPLFLIGIMYFTDADSKPTFKIDQLFARDYSEEISLLHYLNELFDFSCCERGMRYLLVHLPFYFIRLYLQAEAGFNIAGNKLVT